MASAAAAAAASSSGGEEMWGEWMTSWRVGGGDEEAERIDRQKAAFGAETLAKLKDLNVLIVGCRGAGVETAKNLILSNVGSVTLWDFDAAACEADRGANFYVTAEAAAAGESWTAAAAESADKFPPSEATRLGSSLPMLRSLNPYCKVAGVEGTGHGADSAAVLDDAFLTNKDVAGGKGFAAVVVTELLPRAELARINAVCRGAGIAFVLAANTGVTAHLFSDFGPEHVVADANGEPNPTLAILRLEVLPLPAELHVEGIETGSKVAIITSNAPHDLEDGDFVKLDDMQGSPELEGLNGREVAIKRVYLRSPTDAQVDYNKSVAPLLKGRTDLAELCTGWAKQIAHFQGEADAAGKKLSMRELNMGVLFVLDFAKRKPELKLSNPEAAAAAAAAAAATACPADLDVSALAAHKGGGLFSGVKTPTLHAFESFEATLEGTANPRLLFGEKMLAGAGIDVHLALAAVLEFRDAEGRWPGLHNAADAGKLVETAQALSDKRAKASTDDKPLCHAQVIEWGFPSGDARPVDAKIIGRYASLFRAELTGLCAYLGGAAAQEVIKMTGKFTPIAGWIHHDEQAIVQDDSVASNNGPLTGSRYDYQIAVMGQDFQNKISQQRVFLVGCGALGCEYLKGISLMGVATDEHRGRVLVTDMDTIEVSNLSRQFLFRRPDVQKPKAEVGARVVKEWNPDVNIEAVLKRVGNDSEDYFSDTFWQNTDIVWNALDNVQARRYIDGRCLWYGKPLLESGTLGTNSNSEVILPHRSSSYSDGTETDDNETKIAMCTLRSFPYLPLHCVEFAKQLLWADKFEFGPEQFEAFRTDKLGFFERLEDMHAEEKAASLAGVARVVEMQDGGKRAVDFAGCVRTAHEMAMSTFRNDILDVQHFGDKSEEGGKPFWTGTKRRPNASAVTSADLDPKTGAIRPDSPNADVAAPALEFIFAAANLFAFVFDIDGVPDRAEFGKVFAGLDLTLPDWAPSDKKIQTEENETAGGDDADADADSEDDDDDAGAGAGADTTADTMKMLMGLDESSLKPVRAHDFEKDDDLNFHVDFLTAATNLRAWNYNIKKSDRHWVKVTVGNIIPALATTTAMVCGLNDIEFCKLVLGLQNRGRDEFLNSNINLATGSEAFNAFNPEPPLAIANEHCAALPAFTSWDKFEFAPQTPESLVKLLATRLGVAPVTLFAAGHTQTPVYSELDMRRLDWVIEWTEGHGKGLKFSPEATERWPALKSPITKAMLARDPSTGSYKATVAQIDGMIRALGAVKASARAAFEGPIEDAVDKATHPYPDDDDDDSDDDDDDDAAAAKARQEKATKIAYWEALRAARDYVVIVGDFVDIHTKKEVRLPPLKIKRHRSTAAESDEAATSAAAGAAAAGGKAE